MFLNKFYLNLNLGLISKGKKQTKSTTWPGTKPSPAGPTPFLSPFLFLPSLFGPTAGRATHSSLRAPFTPPRVAAAWGPPVSCRLPPSAARCSICAAAASPHSSALLLHASSPVHSAAQLLYRPVAATSGPSYSLCRSGNGQGRAVQPRRPGARTRAGRGHSNPGDAPALHAARALLLHDQLMAASFPPPLLPSVPSQGGARRRAPQWSSWPAFPCLPTNLVDDPVSVLSHQHLSSLS